jgi:hypothetical protein
MKELYSSRVHTFRVFGRSSHPRKDGPDLTASLTSENWQLLGSFTAENRRGTQAFSLPQRSRVRYLLLSFDTHYGSEVMCAMNWIEVLGVSAAQELEEALALQELEAEGEEHDHQQLFAAQQLEQMQKQQQQVPVQQQQVPLQQQQQQQQQHASQQTPVAEPVQQQLQQQPEASRELQQQQAAVPAAAAVDAPPADADKSIAQTPAGGTGPGVTGGSSEQQQLRHASDSAAEEQQQGLASVTAAQQASAQTAAATVDSSSLGRLHDTPTGTTLESVTTSPAAASSQLADAAASGPGQPTAVVDPSGATGATAAAAQQQHMQNGGDGTSAASTDGQDATPAVQQQQQQAVAAPPSATPVADNGKQQQQQMVQPQSNAVTPGPDAQPVLPAAAQPVQGSVLLPADAAASTDSEHPAGLTVEQQQQQQQPAPVAATVATGAEGGSTATQGEAGSTATQTVTAEQQRSSMLAASNGDALTVADLPAVSGSGADAAAVAAAQPAAAAVPGAVHRVPSTADAPASSTQQQQPLASQPPQQQPAVIQQQQPAVPQQQQQQQKKAPLREGASVLESWSSTAKPKQAGNLFDIIKSEMMQLKLDQSKVSKKLDGLAKRSSDFEAAVTLLQQQHAQVLAQIENLTTRLEKVAEQQQQQAAAARQFMSHHQIPGPAGAAAPGGPGVLHHAHVHLQPGGSSMPGHGMGAGASIPVCESHLHQRQLLLQAHFQWGIVTALSLTCVLGLCLLLHPRCDLLPSWLRVAVCCLAVLNGLLAGLLSVWLLVVHPMLLGPAVLQVPAQPFVQLPTHRMLGSSAWEHT